MGNASTDNYRITYPLSVTVPAHVTKPVEPVEPTAPVEKWVSTTPSYTDWVVVKDSYSCTTWLPDVKSLTAGAYAQNSSDCLQDKSRVRQPREQEVNTQAFRDVGVPVTELASTPTGTLSRNINVLSNAWAPLSTSCENWSPDVSTVEQGTQFQQNGTNCDITQQQTVRFRVTGGTLQTKLGDQRKVTGATAVQQAVGTKPYEWKDATLAVTGINYSGILGSTQTDTPGYFTITSTTGVQFSDIDFVSGVSGNSNVHIGPAQVVSQSCSGSAGDFTCLLHIDASMTVDGNSNVTSVWNGKPYLSNSAYFTLKNKRY
jgi:hypothetical protein